MRKNLPQHFQIGAIIVVLILIAAYEFLPQRTWELTSNPEYEHVIAGDSDSGGQTTVEWVSKQNNHFRCDLQPGFAYPYCGFHFLFDPYEYTGVDMSDYDTMRILIRYVGRANHLRLYVRNYNPEFGGDKVESAKYISLNLRTVELNKEIEIDFDEFAVADWWKREFNAPRNKAQPEFNNVVSLGLDVFAPAPFGKHEVAIESLLLVGPLIERETWYLGILIGWLILAAGMALERIITLRRKAQMASARVEELTEDNQNLQDLKDHFKELSTNDPLTGVRNRLGVNQALERALRDREANAPITVILIDIDHFKRINDRRGHDTGDVVLAQFSDILRRNTRGADILGRWGGEEFILICMNTTAKQAFVLSEKVRDLVATTAFGESKPLMITASFGIAEMQPDEEFEETFKRADECLYTAKEDGRNCTVVSSTAGD